MQIQRKTVKTVRERKFKTLRLLGFIVFYLPSLKSSKLHLAFFSHLLDEAFSTYYNIPILLT